MKKKHEHHGLLDATTLAGAVAGSASGLVAGPPGVLAGGAIGTAIGYLAGAVLEDEDNRAEEHDEELDEAIGVTSPDLGAREVAKAGVDAIEHRARKRKGHAIAREKALERSLERAKKA
jgi:phage tail tape-measure protein